MSASDHQINHPLVEGCGVSVAIDPAAHASGCQWKPLDENHFHFSRQGRNYEIELLQLDLAKSRVRVRFGRKKMSFEIVTPVAQRIRQLGYSNGASLYDDALVAPMPGLVLDVRVEVGQFVSKGEHLATLEAMKMENILRSNHDGRVREVLVKPADKVEKNQTLILFEKT
ncbi:MAG: acetyl-CoA carboxylase biotin carboxyl carrier protein subunit [Saprospiraceae bacterium]|nr:acetyl-CoA carboxylase biotin carboxyl carrier protein subunit [Saprospiraceae bacterium]